MRESVWCNVVKIASKIVKSYDLLFLVAWASWISSMIAGYYDWFKIDDLDRKDYGVLAILKAWQSGLNFMTRFSKKPFYLVFLLGHPLPPLKP